MTREIKFRFWNTNDKQMLQGSKSFHSNQFSEERWIPMQFTGLKDKKGKEIYEGDIIEWICNNGFPKGDKRGGVVEFEGCEFFIRCYGNIQKIFNGFSFDSIRKHSFKVIGNKFENPELLK